MKNLIANNGFIKQKPKNNIGKRNKLLFYIAVMALPCLQFVIFWVFVNINSILLAFRDYNPDLNTFSFCGFDNFKAVISDLATADKKYEPLKNIAEQARLSAMDETDIEKDYQKFCEAIKIYEDIKIITPKGEFAPHVARWQSYGSGKDNQVYKIIDMAGGEALTSSKMTTEQKHDMAVAYTTVELCNLLAGKKWDTDRHQGQQNFEQKDFSNFVIGIFDTGAQMAKGPNKRDKVFLGKMLYGMIRAARNGENITEYMLKKVKQIDKLGKIFNFDTLYIDDVQRGLTALSDIMTYQKEVKNEKGEVIVPEKSLTSEEIGQIATAIIDSGLMDKDIYNTIKAKAILNKFGVFRKGWAKSLSEGISKIASSIKIEKRDKPIMFVRIQRKDKPVIEQENMTAEDKKTKKLGVSTKHIAKKETNTSLINTIRSRLQKNVS
jgi:ABC-type sugar transport system permease subunit